MKDFWLKDEDQTYALKPVKRKDIIAAEKQLGVELPSLYKKLVKKQNGGYIRRTLFPISFVTDHVEEFIEVRSLYGIGEDGSSGCSQRPRDGLKDNVRALLWAEG